MKQALKEVMLGQTQPKILLVDLLAISGLIQD